MTAAFTAILLYARDPAATGAFYQRHFGFTGSGDMIEGIIELRSPDSGLALMIHQAARSLKQGQAAVKLVFSVRDVAGFKEQCADRGLAFGPLHQANGYAFANAKDPDGNSVSISSRAFRAA